VDLDGRHFSAQLHAASPEDAISDLIDSGSITDFARVCRRDAGQVIDEEELAVWPGTVTTHDIVLFVPQGINKFLCQFARAGKYIFYNSGTNRKKGVIAAAHYPRLRIAPQKQYGEITLTLELRGGSRSP
jgi:hypothetical protein